MRVRFLSITTVVISTFIFVSSAVANPITVTGITKVVDGTTPFPGSPGYFVRDTLLYPDGDSFENGQSLSNDGTNVSFLACLWPENLGCVPNALSSDGVSVDWPLAGLGGAGTVDLEVSRDGNNIGVVNLVNFFTGLRRPELWDVGTLTQTAQGNDFGADIIVDGTSLAYNFGNVQIHVNNLGVETIRLEAGKTIPGGGALFTQFRAPDLSNDKVVAVGFDDSASTNKGVYTDSANCPGCSGTAPFRVARIGDAAPVTGGGTWSGFADLPAIDGNQIAFVGNGSLTAGGTFDGVFLSSASGTELIADFGTLAITDSEFIDISNGTVAFGETEVDVRLWNNGDIITVISAGDTLDGKIVQKVRVVRDALADNSIAFPLEFTDGTEAIYKAEFTIQANVVEIDVTPTPPATTIHPHHDGGPNAIAGLNDVINVAVMGASTLAGDPADFDTDDIDPASLRFGPGEGPIDPSSTPQFNTNYDNDGLDDAEFDFLTGDSGISCADRNPNVTLKGETIANVPFEGTDAIVKDCDAVCHN
jgi:hypothetical protein